MILKKMDSCKFLQLFAEFARIVYSSTSLNEPTSQRVITTVFCFRLAVVTSQLIQSAIA